MEKTPQCTPAELEQVMVKYGNAVYRLAYAQMRSTADAEDIYQEVFLRYFQKRPRFESEEHRRAWLLRVTLNRARTVWGSAWFRRTVPLDERVVFEKPEEKNLDEALGKLRSGEREVLHLFYYEELSVREIGELLKRKESTVRTQLTRARQHLADILKGDAYDESAIPGNE